MKFEIYLSENMNRKWEEYYIQYSLLKELIENIIENKPEAEKIFCKKLDKGWVIYYNFINKILIKDISQRQLGKNDIIDILEINSFIHINREGFRKIIKKHDKNSSYKLYPAWKWKIKYNPTFKLYNSIKAISDLYKERTNIDIENTVSSTSFKRTNIKFWVKKENIIPIICNILPHLPVHLWDEDINEHIYQATNSVYLGNTEFDIYHERINKMENNKLIRIRWYGEEMDNVFVERKVHHDNWTLLSSSKDRFQIHSKYIMPFLRGDLKVNNDLASEIQNEIKRRKLYPKVRTVYKRIAFQLRHSNDIRISLDVELKMIKEKTSHLEWFTDEENLLDEDIYHFPYAILELKLSERHMNNPPQWINDIINSDLIIECSSFSKFIHSTYNFYGNQNIDKPLWVSNEHFKYSWNNSQSSISRNSINETNQSIVRWCFPFGSCAREETQITNPVKIEPKTFFANERTYLQWFNASIFTASAGMTIEALSEEDKNPIAMFLIMNGILTILYSSFIYYRRNKALMQRKSDGYSDLIGPLLLSGLTAIAFIFSMIYSN